MNRWPIPVLACLALCACQTGAPVSDQDCPTYNFCGDPDPDAFLAPGTTLADWKPVFPGCPSTLQVVFHAARPDDDTPGLTSDPSDSACEGPEPSLLRAAR